MKAILIKGEKSSDIKLLIDLAKKLDLKIKILSQDDREDIALGNAMVQEETCEYLSKNDILKKLSE